MLKFLSKYRGLSPWEIYVASLNPDIWLKMTEANAAAFVADGNWGTAGGTASVSTAGGAFFGATSVTPSDSSRTSFYRTAVNDACYISTTAVAYLNTATIVCALKYDSAGSSGSTQIIYRDQSLTNGGGWFLDFSGTNIAFRVRGANITTGYATSNVKNGSPHLIGLSISASAYALYVDGVSVASGAIGGSTAARSGWCWSSNTSPFNAQAMAGWYGDFITWTITFTATDHANLYAHWI